MADIPVGARAKPQSQPNFGEADPRMAAPVATPPAAPLRARSGVPGGAFQMAPLDIAQQLAAIVAGADMPRPLPFGAGMAALTGNFRQRNQGSM